MTTSVSVTAAVTKKSTLPVHHHSRDCGRDCALALALGLALALALTLAPMTLP